MSVKDWYVGQEVTIHFPYANQGSPKCINGVVKKLRRKYIEVSTASGRPTVFDATMEVPRNGHEELYTRDGYLEMQYKHQVHLALQDFWKLRKMPIDLLLQLGDLLAVERPKHLRKDNQDEKRTDEPLSFSGAPHIHKYDLRK